MKGEKSNMKNLIRGLIFWIIALAFIFAMWVIAEALSKIVTINMIMNLVYVLLAFSIVYILKNFQKGSEKSENSNDSNICYRTNTNIYFYN